MRVHRSVFGRAIIKVNHAITASRPTRGHAAGIMVYECVVVLVAVLFVHKVHLVSVLAAVRGAPSKLLVINRSLPRW